MRCEVCKRDMTPLFFSYACDHCDGLRGDVAYHSGYVVWRGRPAGSEEYVFQSEADAARWRTACGLDGCPIRKVFCEASFQWHESTGSVKGVTLANHLYQIYPDHRFESGPYRAFLAN